MINAPPIKPQIPHSYIPVMFGEHWCASWYWCSSTRHNNHRKMTFVLKSYEIRQSHWTKSVYHLEKLDCVVYLSSEKGLWSWLSCINLYPARTCVKGLSNWFCLSVSLSVCLSSDVTQCAIVPSLKQNTRHHVLSRIHETKRDTTYTSGPLCSTIIP